MIVGCFLVVVFLSVDTAFGQGHADHGLVGLRPLPRTAKMDHSHNHGGSWAGTPTYEEQKGNYPFVAKNLDVVKGGWMGILRPDASFLNTIGDSVRFVMILIQKRTF